MIVQRRLHAGRLEAVIPGEYRGECKTPNENAALAKKEETDDTRD
jgi:hypothetical protein